MRGVLIGVVLGAASPLSFGQMLDSDIHYYAYGNLSHNLIFLGSAESRTGGGVSLAFGRREPKMKLYHKYEPELIWEAYYLETTTKNTTVQFPIATSHAWGALSTARFRWPSNGHYNFYGDFGLGIQFIDHATRDLPLCNNFTVEFGTGIEFKANERTSYLLGTRFMHQSNAGRKHPNLGQNLLQWYIGVRL